MTTFGQGDKVWASTDGINWTEDTISTDSSLQSITATHNGFLLGGVTTTGEQASTWVSTDGLTWKRTRLGVRVGPVFVAADRSAMVADDTSSGLNTLWWSRNGRSWTSAALHGDPIIGTRYGVNLVSTPVGFIELGGIASELFWSSNGKTWRPITSIGAPLTALSALSAVYVDSEGLLVCTQASSFWQVVLLPKAHRALRTT